MKEQASKLPDWGRPLIDLAPAFQPSPSFVPRHTEAIFSKPGKPPRIFFQHFRSPSPGSKRALGRELRWQASLIRRKVSK